jgi:hypothetical protein
MMFFFVVTDAGKTLMQTAKSAAPNKVRKRKGTATVTDEPAEPTKKSSISSPSLLIAAEEAHALKAPVNAVTWRFWPLRFCTLVHQTEHAKHFLFLC